MRKPIMTAPREGGKISICSDSTHPIRFYSDRTIEDDYALKFGVKRDRMGRREWQRLRAAVRESIRNKGVKIYGKQ